MWVRVARLVMAGREEKTLAIVLRRTNYGEADRILQLLTPNGKRGVLARGVRKERSKLAGGVELFSVSEVIIREGRGELGMLTGARLVEYFDALVKDLELIELAGTMMRVVNRRAEQVDAPEFFDLLRQALRAMQRHAGETGVWKEVLAAWWQINLARASGEEANLCFDVVGQKLEAEGRYAWNAELEALERQERGQIGAEAIKFLRVLNSVSAEMALRVRGIEEVIPAVAYVVKCLG